VKANSSILITRHLKSDSKLRIWAKENQVDLIEQSFIEFESIKNLNIPQTDWIFFSSPTGVEMYIENYEIIAKKIAVFGEGTDIVLGQHGLKADYVGDSTKTSAVVGIDFFSRINSERVLFPISQLSRKGVASQGGENKIIELITYHTNIVEKEISELIGTIIFTSPSNVDGYLLKNIISDNVNIIPFGETTAEHLSQFVDNDKIQTPRSPKEEDLIKLLEEF